MAYRYGKRHEQSLFPASIEDYVPAESPVRAYDAFVDALDFGELGIELDSCKVGNSSYDPRAMLKLLVYGYSYGVRSSRKLERETHYNLSFIWLTGGLKPDHKTIADYRRKHRAALRKVLKQCARLCLKLDLIAGNTLFVDGSKIRANASLSHHWTEDRCRKRLEKIDSRIEEILSECDLADDQESGSGSLVAMQEELTDQQTLRRKVEETLKQLQADQKASVNTTDPDCVRIHGRKIVRYVNEEFRERLQSEYEQPDSQAIYKLHKEKAELPFGHIKRNLNAGHFLLRGLDGVRAEASLLASCFNLARMITLIGVPALIAKLAN